MPSQLKRPHIWKTRPDPFGEDWSWVVSHLERDPALQGTTLFALLSEQHPGRYRPTQVRTLQQHIAQWKAVHGPEREVIFEQQHTPGERAQSDFTHMDDLAVTLFVRERNPQFLCESADSALHTWQIDVYWCSGKGREPCDQCLFSVVKRRRVADVLLREVSVS